MWRNLELRFNTFTEDNQNRIIQAAGLPRGDFTFGGFDGNDHQGHFGIACYLINDLNLYEEFNNHDLNSHYILSLPGYQRMLNVYNELNINPNDLDIDMVIDICNAFNRPN